VVLANLLGPDGLIIVICVVVVLLFGGAKLPKLARGVGSAANEFKKGLSDGDSSASLPQSNATGQGEQLPKDSSTTLPKDSGTN
jgi:sec-independent protein translocase protein TatA